MKRFKTGIVSSRSAQQQLDLFGSTIDWIKNPALVNALDAGSEALANPATEQAAQFDLFLHSPFDQALNGLKQAILRSSVETAEQFYHSAKAIYHRNSANCEQPGQSNALKDAEACIQFIVNASAALGTRAQWHWLDANKPALLRFVGAGINPMLDMRLKILAMDSEMDEFFASEPDAYAAQIWLALNEPAFAKAALARDAGSKSCPHRLQLWAQVSAAPELTFHDAAKLESLGYWLALCFDWPEHAEAALPLNPRFSAKWSQFCDLDCASDISNFPGFSSLYGIPWRAPDQLDHRPGAKILRACQALNCERDSAKLRLALKALAPEIFHYWMKNR